MLLDVRHVASFTDYFVIANAINPRQARALIETLSKGLREESVEVRHQEGKADSGWVLLDYSSVIVHIFAPKERAFYALEELWQGATQVVKIQ